MSSLTLSVLTDAIHSAHPELDPMSKGLMLADMINRMDNVVVKPEVKPVHSPAKRSARKTKDVAAWTLQAAIHGSNQHVRIVAAEFAIADGQGDMDKEFTGYLPAHFSTKGEASAYYQALVPQIPAGSDIRENSAYWNEAKGFVAEYNGYRLA